MKQNFFTKKNLIVVSLIVIVVYFVAALGPYYIYKYNVERKKQAALQSYEEKQTKLTEEQKAIQKAEKYLVDNFVTIKAPQRLFLDYLHRKFDINKKFSVAESPMEFSGVNSNSPQEIDMLARIAYPEKLVRSVPPGELDALTYTNIYGANCDHLKLPKDFWKVVEVQIEKGGYHLTHVGLMLAMMKDNKCALPNNIDQIKATLNEGMIKIADDASTRPDLRYEAIAFLMLGEKHDEIKPEWIKRIISEQHSDGSWSNHDSYQDIDHTTLLAYWALLEYQYSDQPYEPIIRRPTQQP